MKSFLLALFFIISIGLLSYFGLIYYSENINQYESAKLPEDSALEFAINSVSTISSFKKEDILDTSSIKCDEFTIDEFIDRKDQLGSLQKTGKPKIRLTKISKDATRYEVTVPVSFEKHVGIFWLFIIHRDNATSLTQFYLD